MRARSPIVLLILVALAVLSAVAAPSALAAPSVASTDPLALLAVQQAELTATDGAADSYFGYVVALDGDNALVGAYCCQVAGNEGQGAAYVFTCSDGSWSQQAELTADDGAAKDHFGFAVALDGDTALVGVPSRTVAGNEGQGAAYVFTRSDGSWSQQAEFTATDGSAHDTFGYAVALDGDTTLVGASDRQVAGNEGQGAAYVFTRSDGSWSQQAELTADDGAAYDYFGTAVALNGNTALVGAPSREVDGNTYQGAAYVFTRSDGSWSQQGELIATAGASGDNFGTSVALDGDTALVGASGRTVAGNEGQGAAYVFTRSGSSWSQQGDALAAADGTASDWFGCSVAVSGNTALIGAYGSNCTYQGAAYVFTRSGSSWSQQGDALTAADGVADDCFGRSVAVSGNTALVGAYGHGSYQGAAYVFVLSPAVTTVTPTAAKRGASVTITGSSFGASRGTSSVSFGGTQCTEYASWSDTSITCTVPTSAAEGAQDVTVTTNGGTSDAVSFTVLPYEEPTVTITGADSAWHTAPVELTVTATVDPSLTLSSLEYSSDGGATWTEIPGSGLTRTLTISANGETTVQVRATDSASQTATDSATVKIDDQTPTITASGASAKWRRSPVTLTFTPSTGPSGVGSVEYKLGAGEWTTLEKAGGAYALAISRQGKTTVRYRATSLAGLVSATGSCTVKIDRTSPRLRLAARSLKIWTRAGRTLRVRLRWSDAASTRAILQARLTQYGTQKQQLCRLTLARRGQWQVVTLRFRPRSPGRYALHLLLTDQGGQSCRGSALVVARR